LKSAEKYLGMLEGLSTNASRVVDKSPENSNFLGIIYSVFPNARVIYMQRDPIDTCLSCYFQQFLTSLNFTFDLSDLGPLLPEQPGIMAHWRAVLAAGVHSVTCLRGTVADQETWSRKMLSYGLEWAHSAWTSIPERQVVTPAPGSVRQKIYKRSVARWRNYEEIHRSAESSGKVSLARRRSGR